MQSIGSNHCIAFLLKDVITVFWFYKQFKNKQLKVQNDFLVNAACFLSFYNFYIMYLQGTLKAALVLPAAVFLHTISYYNLGDVNHNSTESSIRYVKDNELGSCNCTYSSRFNAVGGDVMSKLIEINIPEENRMKIINMLDNLEWIKVKKNNSKWNLNVIRKNADFLAEKSGAFVLMLVNVCSLIATHIIVTHSILGVLLKIGTNHLKSFMSSFKEYVTTTRHSTQKTDDESSDDMFLECSSIILKDRKGIDSEEILAKENQPDEKYLKTSTGDTDNGYESFVQPIHYHQHDSVLNSTPRISTPRLEHLNETTDVVPEKFKQFLHQKSDNVERLGISFSEDGYILEDEGAFSEADGDESLCGY